MTRSAMPSKSICSETIDMDSHAAGQVCQGAGLAVDNKRRVFGSTLMAVLPESSRVILLLTVSIQLMPASDS